MTQKMNKISIKQIFRKRHGLIYSDLTTMSEWLPCDITCFWRVLISELQVVESLEMHYRIWS